MPMQNIQTKPFTKTCKHLWNHFDIGDLERDTTMDWHKLTSHQHPTFPMPACEAVAALHRATPALDLDADPNMWATFPTKMFRCSLYAKIVKRIDSMPAEWFDGRGSRPRGEFHRSIQRSQGPASFGPAVTDYLGRLGFLNPWCWLIGHPWCFSSQVTSSGLKVQHHFSQRSDTNTHIEVSSPGNQAATWSQSIFKFHEVRRILV